MIRRALLTVALVLCGSAAFAAPTVTQYSTIVGGAANVTAVFSFAPTNGDVVSFIDASSNTNAPTGFTDSNSVSLTQRASFVQGSISEYGYDYTASGSPNGNYVCASTNSTCIKTVGIEISGSQTPGTYTSGGNAASTPSLTINAAVGDVVFCGVSTPSTAETLTFTGATTATLNPGGNRTFAYGTASATSVTVTGSGSAAWAGVCADYTATGGGGATVHGLLTLGVGYEPFAFPFEVR